MFWLTQGSDTVLNVPSSGISSELKAHLRSFRLRVEIIQHTHVYTDNLATLTRDPEVKDVM